MEFFARTNPDDVLPAIRCDLVCQIHHPNTGDLGHHNFTALHPLQTIHTECYCSIARDQETSHARVGDRQPPGRALSEEIWNHAAPAADNVSISHDAESCIGQMCAI